jgi:hypothetical protein
VAYAICRWDSVEFAIALDHRAEFQKLDSYWHSRSPCHTELCE